MFAIAALVCFVLGFIFGFTGTTLEHVNLLYLGLAFLTLHLLYPWSPWVRR